MPTSTHDVDQTARNIAMAWMNGHRDIYLGFKDGVGVRRYELD